MSMERKPARVTVSRKQLRLAEQAVSIRATAPSFKEKAYLTKHLVQATLPHRTPRNNPPEWSRRNGNLLLSIRPGFVTDDTSGERRCVGYPWGPVPRLLMVWMNSQVKKGSGRRMRIGDTLREFLEELGLNPGTGGGPRSDRVRVRDQMNRLLRATISFEYMNSGNSDQFMHMVVAKKAELWWSATQVDQVPLWDSYIELGETFYEALRDSPGVPLDYRALRALKDSPLALDLYSFVTYNTYRANRDKKPKSFSWRDLMEQFGAGYARPDNLQAAVEKSLGRVAAVYTGFNVERVPGGLRVLPGQTAIAI